MTKAKQNDRIGKSSAAKPIPHIPLPFEEVMSDVLKVKPPVRDVQRKTKGVSKAERKRKKA